jgi:hypothetical protein
MNYQTKTLEKDKPHQKCGLCGQQGHKAPTCPTREGADPNLRRCWSCKTWKPLGDFPVANKAKGKYQRTCTICLRPYRRAWYGRHKTEQKARSKQRMKVKVTEHRALVQSLKAKPCTDCGGTFHHAAMQFDHVKTDKIMDIARMKNNSGSTARLLREIAKCELVCANCHHIRTWRRREASKQPSRTEPQERADRPTPYLQESD